MDDAHDAGGVVVHEVYIHAVVIAGGHKAAGLGIALCLGGIGHLPVGQVDDGDVVAAVGCELSLRTGHAHVGASVADHGGGGAHTAQRHRLAGAAVDLAVRAHDLAVHRAALAGEEDAAARLIIGHVGPQVAGVGRLGIRQLAGALVEDQQLAGVVRIAAVPVIGGDHHVFVVGVGPRPVEAAVVGAAPQGDLGLRLAVGFLIVRRQAHEVGRAALAPPESHVHAAVGVGDGGVGLAAQRVGVDPQGLQRIGAERLHPPVLQAHEDHAVAVGGRDDGEVGGVLHGLGDQRLAGGGVQLQDVGARVGVHIAVHEDGAAHGAAVKAAAAGAVPQQLHIVLLRVGPDGGPDGGDGHILVVAAEAGPRGVISGKIAGRHLLQIQLQHAVAQQVLRQRIADGHVALGRHLEAVVSVAPQFVGSAGVGSHQVCTLIHADVGIRHIGDDSGGECGYLLHREGIGGAEGAVLRVGHGDGELAVRQLVQRDLPVLQRGAVRHRFALVQGGGDGGRQARQIVRRLDAVCKGQGVECPRQLRAAVAEADAAQRGQDLHMKGIHRLLAAAAGGRCHGEGHGVVAQVHAVAVVDVLAGLIHHVRTGRDGAGPRGGGGGHGRAGLGGHRPEIVAVPAVRVEGAALCGVIVVYGVVAGGDILLEVLRPHQRQAVQIIVPSHVARRLHLHPQGAEAVGAGCRRHRHGIALPVDAVLGRHRERHGALGEVQRAVRRFRRGPGTDAGDHLDLCQIGAVGQHPGVAAVGGDGGHAVDRHALELAGVVQQLLILLIDRHPPLAGDIPELPRGAVQRHMGVAVQLVQELLLLHIGQLHGHGAVADVHAAHCRQQADVLIVVAAEVCLGGGFIRTAMHKAHQVARHRLRLLRAVLHGAGVVAVVNAHLQGVVVAGAVLAHQAAHLRLLHLHGAQVVAVLHDALGIAGQTAGPLPGLHGAVVGAAHHDAHGFLLGAAIAADLAHHAAGLTAGHHASVVGAADHHPRHARDAAGAIAAGAAEAAGVGVGLDAAVVGAVDEGVALRRQTAHAGIRDLTGGTGGIHRGVAGAVDEGGPCGAADEAAHIGAGGDGAALVQRQVLDDRAFGQQAEQTVILAGGILEHEVLDTEAVAVVDTVKGPARAAGAGGVADGHPRVVLEAGQVDVGGLPEVDALRFQCAVVDLLRQRFQRLGAGDQVGTGLGAGALQDVVAPRLRGQQAQRHDQRDGQRQQPVRSLGVQVLFPPHVFSLKRRGAEPRVLYRCAAGRLGPAGKRYGTERAGTLSIPYGKQAAFAGRLGLTGDVRSFRIKNAGAPFRSHQRLIG